MRAYRKVGITEHAITIFLSFLFPVSPPRLCFEVFHWQLTDTAREKHKQITKHPKVLGRKAIESVKQKFKRSFKPKQPVSRLQSAGLLRQHGEGAVN